MIIMIELRIQKVGTGLGVELPKAVLEQLEANKGESIFLENMFDGSYQLAKHDEKFIEQMILVDTQIHEEDA